MKIFFQTLATFGLRPSFANRSGSRATAARRAPRRFRPRLEALEDRLLLTAYTAATAADLIADMNAANKTGGASTIALTAPATSPYALSEVGLPAIGANGAVNLTIVGNDDTIERSAAAGTPAFGLLGVTRGSSLTLESVTLENGRTARGGSGGGISNQGNVTLNQCTISGDSASLLGGGIFNAGTLTATNCTVSGNVAGGGGIYNHGELTLNQCTISGDSAIGGLGGGIDVQAGFAWLTNCTIAENVANAPNFGTFGSPPEAGGGLYLAGSATYLTNCTVSLNQAKGLGGAIAGGIAIPQGTFNVVLANTIVAGNTDGTGTGGEQFAGADIYGSVVTADHNLIGNGDGANIFNGVNGNIVGGEGNPVINAMLGPLANNGGPTETMSLLVGSPAIGNADNAAATATDQRGVTRQDAPGEATDIGAFEL
jgi:hypothetical protein